MRHTEVRAPADGAGRVEKMTGSENPAKQRYVLNIYRMTTHNGPGIRTLVQFKGCPLRCLWCAAPESQAPEPEIYYSPSKCIGCGSCERACRCGAIAVRGEKAVLDRGLCVNCGDCAAVCFPGALVMAGRPMTVGEIVDEAKKDKVFYDHSGGGVTLTGGEPLSFPDFTLELLRALKAEGIGTGVDTSGYAPRGDLERMIPYIDFFLWDIKHMDPGVHRELTGVSNERILENAAAASRAGVPIYLRLPVIPGYNDSQENISAVCDFAITLPSLVEVDLLPVHHLGKAAYEALGRPYPIPSSLTAGEEALQDMKAAIMSRGLKCRIVA